jgi:hypothetical protein
MPARPPAAKPNPRATTHAYTCIPSHLPTSTHRTHPAYALAGARCCPSLHQCFLL